MAQTVKQSTRTVTRTVRIPFDKKGNIDVGVNKIDYNLGDGDIGTGKDSTKYSSVSAQIYCEKNSQVRLHVRFEIKESKFGTQKNHDGLYMDFNVTQSVADFFNEGYQKESENGGRIKREYTPQSITFLKSYSNAYTRWKHTGGHHEYIPLVDNNLPDWFLKNELQIKIDDDGNEFSGKGNIGIKGVAVVTIVRTDKVVETVTMDDPVKVNPTQTPKMGNETKVTSFHPGVDSVLGCGYDICGYYADTLSSKDRVVDYKKLNDYQRIRKTIANKTDSRRAYGEGVQEYSRQWEENLSVKVSAYGFGASFANETKKTFKEDTYEKTGYKFATQNDVNIRAEYVVQGNNDAGVMMGFLTTEFLDDLNDPSKTAYDIIIKYGTHVVLGMQVGTIFSYSMSYRQSTQKVSKASTFSNTTSISYDSQGKAKPKEEGGSSTSETEKIYQDLINKKLSPSALNAYTKFLKEAKSVSAPTGGSGAGSGSNPGGGKGGWGVAGEVSYSTSLVQSLLKEDQSTDTRCFARGGNSYLAGLLSNNFDLSVYREWINSCKDGELVFVDYVPGTLMPLYSLIPSGKRITAQQVKDASDRWQKDHSLPTPSQFKRGTSIVPFNTLGSGNTDNINSDNDIWATDGKPTYWRLVVELINFDGGSCGYSISLLASEYGKDASYTKLLNHVANDFVENNGCEYMAIDTSNPSLGGLTTFKAEATWYGSLSQWKDASQEIRNSDVRRVIDLNSPCEIVLDGKGDDLGHVGIRGYLKIPWIGY